MGAARTDDVKRLGELLEGIDFCMLTTKDASGAMHARPMSTQRVEFDGTLRFLTDDSSHKAVDIEANPMSWSRTRTSTTRVTSWSMAAQRSRVTER